ncbi:MAG: ROK family protein [Bacteroidetes bacterium]|nr:ROK family protein [Bacteroidota bacterium]
MDYFNDERIVMTLDAGGTKLSFNAVQAGKELLKPVEMPAAAGNLHDFLKKIIRGFHEVAGQTSGKPCAISFAFPGPADYTNGIIGDLQNLPVFRGGVALGRMLENEFRMPVYINNDGDLFAYGEAMSGLLPEINRLLRENDNSRQYRNLLGITLGTGFGGGIVRNGELFTGDNSAAGEINRLRNCIFPQTSIEDSVTIRAVRRVYAENAGITQDESPEPREIFEIARGTVQGNKVAALKAYQDLAVATAGALADAVSLIDGLVVIGGGLSGAASLFLEDIVKEMNRKYHTLSGEMIDRMEVHAYNLESGLSSFLEDTALTIEVPFSDQKLKYDPVKKIGVGITRLGTSGAVSVGAYAYALDQLNRK